MAAAAAYGFQNLGTVRQALVQAGWLSARRAFREWDGPSLALTAVKMREGTDERVQFAMSDRPPQLTATADRRS